MKSQSQSQSCKAFDNHAGHLEIPHRILKLCMVFWPSRTAFWQSRTTFDNLAQHLTILRGILTILHDILTFLYGILTSLHWTNAICGPNPIKSNWKKCFSYNSTFITYILHSFIFCKKLSCLPKLFEGEVTIFASITSKHYLHYTVPPFNTHYHN